MLENMMGSFGGFFTKIGPDMCRLTTNGQIAIKTTSGYKSYNLEKGILTNQDNFVFNVGQDFFFAMPTNNVKAGDVILIDGKPKCVVKVITKNEIQVINFETSVKETIIPERHILFGHQYLYSRIRSLFGSNLTSKKGMTGVFKGMMQMQILNSLFGNKMSFEGPNAGNNNGVANNGSGNNMMEMMMMMNMFGGGNNGFGDMFDNMLDLDDEDEDEEEDK